MRRGEVWWVEFDERRPVVLLSEEEPSGFRAMQVVAPAGADISGLGVEVAVGVLEGLPFEGVLRLVFPRPGFTPRSSARSTMPSVPPDRGRSRLRPRRPGSAGLKIPSVPAGSGRRRRN